MHPIEDLQRLELSANPELIKKYFTAKTINASSVRLISTSQVHKCTIVLKSAKIKQIFKEKAKKLRLRAATGFGCL